MNKKNAVILIFMLFAGGYFCPLLADNHQNAQYINANDLNQKEPLKIGTADLPELLALLDNLEVKAENPLFELHFKSLRTMLTDTTHDAPWESNDSLWVSNALEFFKNEGSDWRTYADGPRPLIMSFISPSDGKNSYYLLSLPKQFDPNKNNYPFYMELHGSGGGKNDNPRRMLLQPYQPERTGITAQGYRGEGLYIKPWGRGDKGYLDQAETDIYECLDHFDKLFQTDKKRQYLYGFSMGSMGAFHIARENMSRWTAIGFYSGASKDITRKQAYSFKDKPVWIAWGDEERMADNIKAMRDYLIEAGAEVVWYEIKNTGHKYLSNYQEDLMNWFNNQVK